MNVSIADSGTFSCILSDDFAGEMSEENVIVAVFERVREDRAEKNVLHTELFQSDQSEQDINAKYLKFKVKLNFSLRSACSFAILLCCILVSCYT